MLPYKKRIRLLAEECNSSVEYGHDDSIHVRSDLGTTTFASTSSESMSCCIELGDGPRTFSLPKTYMFDLVDRLASPHLVSTLRDYPKPPLLQIGDYINDEYGLPRLLSLQQEIADNPKLVRKELGGNRILAEYFKGVMIFRDDLTMAGTNVIEFDSSSPTLQKAT